MTPRQLPEHASTVLLTGATGYLGSRLLRRLVALGHPVIAVVRDASRVATTSDRVTVVEADITAPIVAPPGLRADWLIHAAAEIDYQASAERLMAVNRDGARHVAELGSTLGVKRAVLVSSLEATGPGAPPELPRPEDATPRPVNDYGRSKLAGEAAFNAVIAQRQMEGVVVRPGNIFGDGDAGFTRHFLEAVESGNLARFTPEWNNARFAPIDVEDVIDGILLALKHGGSGVYHLTRAARFSVGLLMRHITAVARDFGLGVSIPATPDAPPPADAPIHFVQTSTRASAEWNWVAHRAFCQTLIGVLEYRGLQRTSTPISFPPGPIDVVLCNTPSEDIQLSRDMAGGMGFVHASEDRFPPLDLLYLAARLEANHDTCALFDGTINPFNVGDLLHQLEIRGTDAVICEVNLPTFETDLRFLRTLRSAGRARVIARTVLSHDHFVHRLLTEARIDLVLLGECDLTIDRVLRGDDFRGTARLVDGRVVVTPEDKLEELDRLPVLSRAALNRHGYSYGLLGGDFTTIQTSRGCPYSCGYYCPYPLSQGKAWRARSPEHVVREFERAYLEGYRNFLVRDATFTLDKKRTAEICRALIERGLPIRFWCETRINCLDESLLALLAKAGCLGINFGLESGDDEVLKAGAKAGVDVKRIREILDATNRAGITSHLLVVAGLPQETRKSIFETYQLLAELPAKTIGITGITPFPGTDLWFDAVKKNWIKTTEWSQYGANQTVMITDNLSQADIQFAARMMFEWFQMTRKGSGATADSIAEHRARMRAWVDGAAP